MTLLTEEKFEEILSKKLAPLATKKELTQQISQLATKKELKNLVTKEELVQQIAPLATKKDLIPLATSEQVEELARMTKNGFDDVMERLTQQDVRGRLGFLRQQD